MTLLALADGKLPWYLARAGGLVAWALVTASILWGLALSTRLVRRRGAPAWLAEMHRFLGTLSLLFTGVHLAGLVVDDYVAFGAADLLIPMASSWRPGAVAWGIVATYLLVAVEVTSWLLRRLPRRLWHAVHLSSFVLFVTATVHGFAAGTDAGATVVQWLALTGCTLVLFLVVFRVLAPRRGRSRTIASPEPGSRTIAA